MRTSSRPRPFREATHLRGPARAALACTLALTACQNKARPDPHDQAGRAVAATHAVAPANGWGDTIAWREFGDALDIASTEQKPVMLVVHTSWCSKCKALKPSFQTSEFSELSKEFVMVNADQDQVELMTSFAPDGEYIPRIMFLSPEGKLDTNFRNANKPKFQYYYSPADDLTGRMRDVLETHRRAG